MYSGELSLKPTISRIQEELSTPLERAGFYYRVFARSKTLESIAKKINIKKELYKREKKKLQDIIGIRFVFYFSEDIDIFAKYLRSLGTFIDESNSSKDIETMTVAPVGNLCDKVFMPNRLNLIFKMDGNCTEDLQNALKLLDCREIDFIDNTYEVQLRSVLSEGWHEVEHDLRYKCKDDTWWDYCNEESRMLNGIYASLETNERALDYLFSRMAYKNYKNKDWRAMLQNHFRIKFMADSLSQDIKEIFTNNPDLAKFILKYEKSKLSDLLFHANRSFPLKMDNIIHLINEMRGEGKDSTLSQRAIPLLLDIINKTFPKNERG